jgi:hypothetical protein
MYLIISSRFAAQVTRFNRMFTCMCQVNLSTCGSARALKSVRIMIKLLMIMFVDMYASHAV